MVKAVVERRVSEGPLACLSQSRAVLARILKPGDRIGEFKIKEKLHDVDGTIVYVLEDDSYVEVD